jgi:hypothetical protein
MEAGHKCRPPTTGPRTSDHNDDEEQAWTCPECEAVWALEIIGEGQRLCAGGGRTRFTVREWVMQRTPRERDSTNLVRTSKERIARGKKRKEP